MQRSGLTYVLRGKLGNEKDLAEYSTCQKFGHNFSESVSKLYCGTVFLNMTNASNGSEYCS